MIDLPEFDVVIPLVRRNADDTTDSHDVTMRIPALDQEAAYTAVIEIAYAIRAACAETSANRYGWEIVQRGPSVGPARECR